MPLDDQGNLGERRRNVCSRPLVCEALGHDELEGHRDDVLPPLELHVLVRGAERKVQRWVVRDDHSLERAQILAWLESELLDQFEACFLVGAQGIALSAAPIEREHLQVAQTLSPRMAPGERIDLRQDGFVPSELELRVEPQLERRQTELVETAYLDAGRAFEGEVVKRRPAPILERLAQSCGPLARRQVTGLDDGVLEADRVDVLGVEVDQVPGRSRLDHVASQHAAQAEDAVLDVGVNRFRRTLTPKLVDQAIGRHHLIGVEQQEGENPLLLPATEGQRLPAGMHLERTEDTEFHAAPNVPLACARS